MILKRWQNKYRDQQKDRMQEERKQKVPPSDQETTRPFHSKIATKLSLLMKRPMDSSVPRNSEWKGKFKINYYHIVKNIQLNVNFPLQNRLSGGRHVLPVTTLGTPLSMDKNCF